MSVLREFTCFTRLSQELQDLIWSHTFWPQTIILQYAECNPPPVPPHTFVEDHSIAPLEQIDTQTPAAFSVCQISREIAQSKGYKAWKLVRSDGKVRNLLWNPLTDIVFLPGIQRYTFDLFAKSRSAHAGEIQNLALPYSFWDQCYTTETRQNDRWKHRRGSRGMLQLLKKPSSLERLFVVVNKEFFETKVKGKTDDQMEWWIAPWGIGSGFHSTVLYNRKHCGEDSVACPKFSIAWNFEMISRGDDVGLAECSVTDDYFKLKQEWKSWRSR